MKKESSKYPIILLLYLFPILIASLPQFIQAQIIYNTQDSHVILEEQKYAEVGPYIVKNVESLKWKKDKTIISFYFPKKIKSEWLENTVQVKYFNTGNKPEYSVETEKVSKNVINICLPKDLEFGQKIEISKLNLKNLTNTGKKFRIHCFVNNKHAHFKHLFPKLFSNIFTLRQLNTGQYLISDIDFISEKGGKFIKSNNNHALPQIKVKINEGSYLPKNTELSLNVPRAIKKLLVDNKPTIKGINGYNNEDVTYDSRNNKIILKSKVDENQGIIIDNLRINTNKKLKPHKIYFRFNNSNYKKEIKRPILVANPRVKMLNNPKIIVNCPSRQLPELIIEQNSIPICDSKDGILIKLPDKLNFQWDKINSDAQVKFPGGRGNIIYRTPKVLKVNLNNDLVPGENIKISGLRARCNIKSDQISSATLEDPGHLSLFFNDRINKNDSYINIDKNIQLAYFSLQSTQKEIFCLHDPKTRVSKLRIELKSNFKVFGKNEKLVLNIPDELPAKWSFSDVENISYKGTMAENIREINYIDSKNIAIILSSPLDKNDYLVLDNIYLWDFDKCGSGRLKLFTSQSEYPIAEDKNEWRVAQVNFSMSDNQLILDNDDNPKCYKLVLNTGKLDNYLDHTKQINIRIPEALPLEFSPQSQIRFNYTSQKYFYNNVTLENSRNIQFNIRKRIPKDKKIEIYGIQFKKPAQKTLTPKNLQLLIKDKHTGQISTKPIICNKYISIVSSKSRCYKALNYHKLAKSNFRNNETLIVKLSGSENIIWNKSWIRTHFKIRQDEKIFNKNKIKFTDQHTFYLELDQDFPVNEEIVLNGLAVNITTPNASHSYINIIYDNHLHRSKTYTYYIPISFKKEAPSKDRARVNPLVSYPYPLIKFEDKGLKKVYQSENVNLPPLTIKNGNITQSDRSFTNEYKRASANMVHFINKQNWKMVEVEAENLINNFPKLWQGYWGLARALKDKNQIEEAREHYANCKKLGYIPRSKYPAVFMESADDEMNLHITEGIELFNQAQYVKSEEKFLLFRDYEEDLSSEMIAKSYYWLGRIAYALQDYEYANQYFNYSQQYNYGANYKNEYNTSRSISDYIAKCDSSLSSSNDIGEDINPEIGDFTLYNTPQEQVEFSLTTPSKKGEKYKLESIYRNNYNKFRANKLNLLNEREEYKLHYHPVRKSIFKFLGAIIIGGALCTIIIL